ncbi:MAG: ABC transporter ATP-binding protein, partial [Planctomycetota bacterium]
MAAAPFPNARAFGRVLTPADLRKPSSLWTGFYAAVAAVCLVAMLLVLLAGLDLLESRGRVSVPPEQVEAFAALVGEIPPDGRTGPGVTIESDSGLEHVAWWGRDRPVGAIAGWLCRAFPAARSNKGALVVLLLTVIPLGALRAMAIARARRCADQTGLTAITRLRRSLHRQALRLGPGELVDDTVEDVTTLLDRDCGRIRRGAAATVIRLWLAPLEIAAAAAVAFSLHPAATVQCVVPLGAAWLLGRRLTDRVSEARDDAEANASVELSVIRDNVRHARLIRGYGMDRHAEERFETALGRYQSGFARFERTERLERGITRVGVAACLAFVAFLLGAKTLAALEGGVTLASSLTLLACFWAVLRPVESLSKWDADIAPAREAAERVARYLALPPRVAQAVGAKFLQPLAEEITFRGVRYAPAGRAAVLDGLDLTIEAGRTTAVIASDPFAVSTLLDLLNRFVEPDDGVITFDRQDIAWVTLDSLRAETLRVDADGSCLTGTVLENISAGLPTVTKNQVIEAAKAVRAHSFIQNLPQGYETVVGRGGEPLDVGQKYRIGLARAFMRDPAVLIVEEPSGGFDADTKHFVDDAYKNLFTGRTVVIRPSRLSTIKKADTLVLLHGGRVAA